MDRDLSWTIFTILLARRSPEMLGQIAVALSCGYLVKTVSDVGSTTFCCPRSPVGKNAPVPCWAR